MRVMLDTNIFDRLAADPEAASELENRRDLRLVVSEIQLAQLSAIPEPERRERYLELARRLCSKVSAASSSLIASATKTALAATKSPKADSREPDRHEPDRMIAAATAARCDLLVSDDRGLVDYAKRAGVKAIDWKAFAAKIIFATKKT